jgi:hypothetical protein
VEVEKLEKEKLKLKQEKLEKEKLKLKQEKLKQEKLKLKLEKESRHIEKGKSVLLFIFSFI